MLELVGIAAVAAASFALGAKAPPWPGSAAALLVLILAEANVAGESDAAIPVLFATVAPYLIGREARSRRRLAAALAERNRRLEDEEAAFARLAVRRERIRIAQDLHDVVCHHLALIAVQAGAGRLDAADGAGDGDGAVRMAAIHRAACEALDEMEQLTDVLDAAQEGADGLAPVLARARAAGLTVEVEVADRLPAAVPPLMRRVVQEALTNAAKHAPSAAVRLRVASGGGVVRVAVHDTGAREPGVLAPTGSGSGLAAMRARVEDAGGRLKAGPAPDGGWSVVAEWPADTSAEVRDVTPAG